MVPRSSSPTSPAMLRGGRLAALAPALLLAMSALVGGCDVVRLPSDVDPIPCREVRLEAPAQAAGIFAAAGTSCVIIAWDSKVVGEDDGPGQGSGTPEPIRAAAEARGYRDVCSTHITGDQPSAVRTRMNERFPGLDPSATEWSMALFVVDLRDGADPRCRQVDPQS